MRAPDIHALGNGSVNGFLFADIGVDRNGMPLSVLSALARLGLDPWQEASRLARQPRRLAVEGLAQRIAALPASPWPLPDARVIAARLTALLPSGRAAGRAAGAAHGAAGPQAVWPPKGRPRQAILLALVLAVLLSLGLRLPLAADRALAAPGGFAAEPAAGSQQ